MRPSKEAILEVAKKAILEVADEYTSASKAYPPMYSPHEGFAIILEEVVELMREVFKKQTEHDVDAMRKEAKQIAAMAIRFMVDLT